ncbi:FecCD family ABC transporter permease [Yinghuangia sp. YIM S09857]|uniref:FecCD family ABC transporter permease n=1 Tax=Yinghuangia sp. YIM S09857 TaxID=3436929 RepID=UPI003F53BD40
MTTRLDKIEDEFDCGDLGDLDVPDDREDRDDPDDWDDRDDPQGPGDDGPSAASHDASPGPLGGEGVGLRGPLLLLLLGAGVVAMAVVAAGIGAYAIPVGDVFDSVLHRCGLGGHRLDRTAEAVLWEVRFPRIVLTVLIGASLACAGALMQGVFGNPLAEPGVVGVSAGATVGAVLVIFTGATTLGSWTQPAFAFVFGLGTTVLVYVFSRSGGRTEVVTLILTGVALTAVTFAAIGVLTSYSTNDQIQDIAFWQLGSVNGATWEKVSAIAPCAAVGLIAAPMYARRLDLLSLGEKPARHLGVDVERLRIAVILLVALLTSAAVAFSGVIGFVGLVVPHAVRMVTGPSHKLVLPGSMLGGALVLLVGDLASRTLVEPRELPIGALTSLVGGPVFFVLLRRARLRAGGWA